MIAKLINNVNNKINNSSNKINKTILFLYLPIWESKIIAKNHKVRKVRI